MWCANDIFYFQVKLSITWLEEGDVVRILLSLVTSIAIWRVTKSWFCVVLSFLLPFYFIFVSSWCVNLLILNKNKWGLAVQVFNLLIPGKCGPKKEIYFQWYNIWHSELVKFVNHKYDMINDLLKRLFTSFLQNSYFEKLYKS